MSSDKHTIFRQTELFRDLDDEPLLALTGRAVTKKLGRDELLFLAGEPATGMYVIESGSVRAFRTGADGREQIIHVERAVTTIAEVPVFDNGAYPSTVAAEEPTTLYFLSREDVLKTSFAHPQIALAAARLMATRLRRCAELVERLSLREVGQRVASFLLVQARNSGVQTSRGTKLKLELTHTQLAARIGTVREVVTRTLTKLTDEGLILHKGKEILIPNVDILSAYAGE